MHVGIHTKYTCRVVNGLKEAHGTYGVVLCNVAFLRDKIRQLSSHADLLVWNNWGKQVTKYALTKVTLILWHRVLDVPVS